MYPHTLQIGRMNSLGHLSRETFANQIDYISFDMLRTVKTNTVTCATSSYEEKIGKQYVTVIQYKLNILRYC